MGYWSDIGAPYKDANGRWLQNRTYIAGEGEGCNSVQPFVIPEPKAATPAAVEPHVPRSRDAGKLLAMENLNPAEIEILRKGIDQAVAFHTQHGRWPEPA